MNIYKISFILSYSLISSVAHAQSTFQNLNFESASVPPNTPVGSLVPIAEALPGWNGYYTSSLSGTEPTTQVAYDGISTGGAVISLADNNIGTPLFYPLQGNYTALLFGGGGPEGQSVSLSQTGTIPNGTQSILMDAWSYDASPIIAINGQPIAMIPLQIFANYSLYGGTVPSSDVGPSVTLSFTEPVPATGGPSEFELDNITFSPTAVTPEPSTLALMLMGGAALAARRWRANRS